MFNIFLHSNTPDLLFMLSQYFNLGITVIKLIIGLIAVTLSKTLSHNIYMKNSDLKKKIFPIKTANSENYKQVKYAKINEFVITI